LRATSLPVLKPSPFAFLSEICYFCKTNLINTAIKKAFRIVVWSILSLGIIVLAIYFLLGLPSVQQKIKELVLREITKKTQSTISIGNIRFSLFNRLEADELYAGDLKNDTLLYAEKVSAAFDLFKLFHKQLVIHSVEAEGLDLRVSKDSANAPFNFQFLIDAFASDTVQSPDSSSLQMAIDHILLKNGRLRYDVLSEPFQAPGTFDVNHAEIRNLQLDAKLHYTNSDDWTGVIENLSLDEQSGFALKQMKFRVKNLNSRLSVDQFYIALPRSEGAIEEANLDYTGMDLSEVLSGATYSALISSGKWYLGDFVYFYPELAQYPEIVTCSGEVKGKFPGISIPRLELSYGNRLQLALSAGITDYNAWETSAFKLHVKKCRVDPKLFGLPLLTDTVSLTGKIRGSLPNLKLTLTAVNQQGDLTMNGAVGYLVSTGNARFDINLESSGCNLKSLLSDTTFGNLSFRLATQGTITGSNKINAKAEAEISRFDYGGYSFRDITARAAYANDSVSLDVISKDPGLPVTLEAKAGLNEKNPFAQMHARLNGVHPDVLNLLPQYPGTKLSGDIHADVRGFDPEQMSASVVIEGLHWITPTGDFTDSPITLTYNAGADRQKQINFRSPTLIIRGKGNLSYEGIAQSLRQAFHGLFPPDDHPPIKKTIPERENFDFIVDIRQANALARVLGMEAAIPDSALLIGKYNCEDDSLSLGLTAFCVFTRSDTLQVQLNLSNAQNNLAIQTEIRNRSDQFDLEGNIGALVGFVRHANQERPDVKIKLSPGMLTLNGTTFQIRPAEIAIAKDRYEINNFALRHSRGEFVKVSGVISDNKTDSLLITANRFQIGTILSALKNNLPFAGTASGDIALSRLTTQPLVLTRNFVIDNMVFDGKPVGNLQLRSAWSSERQGLALRATWSLPNAKESVISGFFLSKTDSLALTANVRGVQLNWLEGYLPDTFSGLEGELGARIRINGKIDDPVVSGTLYLDSATVGVPMLNTRYRVTDSIFLQKDQIIFQNLIVNDENNRNVKINGTIGHRQFFNLNPRLTLDFNRFLVLNNGEQTDSLFYGLLRLNGNLTVSLQNKDWLIQGKLSNDRANKIMVNFPESAVEAERYNWLTFVDKQEKDSTAGVAKRSETELSAVSLPLRLQITFSVDRGLSVGAVINPDTKDAAVVSGHGILDFSYNPADPVPRLRGGYIIDGGNCTLSLKNITKKTFSVRPGGKLNFQGDIMNATFDLSAMYSLRTYLTDLDPSFASIMTASKVPVNCVLSAGGKFDDMKLQYRIELPNQPDDVQRKLDGLIYTDEMRIKQIAYLLAFGIFLPANSNSMNTGGIWTSLASSSITTQLNHLLSGVLSDNWTIGTNLRSNDSNFSDMDMDVNISTRLFNDRLTLNSTLGYHNGSDEVNNFTGDFNIEYKLSPSGNLLLQFYNVTNNQYYNRSRSPLTQGAGIVYKREGRTFRKLFRSIRMKRRSDIQGM